MSRFAILPELGLNRVELYAESEFCIEWCHFQGGHRTKTATYTPNTPSSDPFRRDSLSAFAILPELGLNRLELYTESNSAYNSTRFRPNSGSLANRDKKYSNMVLTLLT